jgi:hypothetical protein
MQEIYKDGTTQEVFFDAVSADPELGAFQGSTNEQPLTGATVALREYKKPTVVVSNPIITWENTLKKWKLNIPSSYITQYGHVLITIQHSSMLMVTIDCNTVDSDMFNRVRKCELLLASNVTGLLNGAGSPVVFTAADGSRFVYTVDENGNRTISSVTLV